MSGRRAAFVDRDGVINELVSDPISGLPESPLRVEDVALCARAAEALQRLASAGLLLVGVSNQPAAAKGTIEIEQVMAVQRRVEELLRAREVGFASFQLCLHHPDGVVMELSGSCSCRKPAPGMLLAAGTALGVDFASSWMIGDTDADVLAGHAAGCKTVLVQHEASAHKRRDSLPDAVAPDLYAASEIVLQSQQVFGVRG